ncbi:MAG: hypothetical protein A3E25_20430 [Burkholderiales bacterium RIFCSPHIGHO2_12_FULL_69_20]|nr:MAG: hypothetical protein A3E25_20430 [Burkholderiales bacterium RIFCSPHIGHO2_12_FULL_69_20]
MTPPLPPGSTAAPIDLPPVAPDAMVRTTRAVAVAALLGLIALGLAWELWLAPTGERWLVFKVMPLLLPLVGLLKHRLYTYRWVSLLVWLYFTEGIVRATGVPPGADGGLTVPLAWTQVALCTVLFIACAAHVRWRLKHPVLVAGQPAAATAGERP